MLSRYRSASRQSISSTCIRDLGHMHGVVAKTILLQLRSERTQPQLPQIVPGCVSMMMVQFCCATFTRLMMAIELDGTIRSSQFPLPLDALYCSLFQHSQQER